MLRTINRRKSLRDPDFDKCVLLAHFDGADGATTWVDHSKYKRAITRVGTAAAISTAQSKFGGSSYSNNGSASYGTCTDDGSFDFGANNFTVSLWARIANSSNRVLVGRQNANVVVPWTINIGATTAQFFISFNNTSWANSNLPIAETSISQSTWTHLQMVRSGSNFYCFKNGTQVGSTFSNSSSFTDSSRPLMIGSQGSTLHLNGQLDEIAIWNGVAKKTANFTPQPYAHFNN